MHSFINLFGMPCNVLTLLLVALHHGSEFLDTQGAEVVCAQRGNMVAHLKKR